MIDKTIDRAVTGAGSPRGCQGVSVSGDGCRVIGGNYTTDTITSS